VPVKLFPETEGRTDGVWHRVQIGKFEELLREISPLGLTGFVVAR
jgi:hypothetical protein